MQRPRANTLGKLVVGVGRLCRFSNSIPAAVLVLIGAYLTAGWPLSTTTWWAATAMWFVTAFGYVSNDYIDVVEDNVNKPERPLPSGAVGSVLVIAVAIGLAVGALWTSATLGWLPLAIAGAVIVLLLFYNVRLKSVPGVGNLLIGGLAGCTLLTGGVAESGFQWSVFIHLWPLVVLLALFVTAREVLKTVEDIAGDRAAAKQTLATRWGIYKTLQIFACLTLQLLFVTIYVYWTTGRSALYLGIMVVGIIGPLLYSLIYLGQDAAPKRVAHCLSLLKGSYFAGILALLLLVN